MRSVNTHGCHFDAFLCWKHKSWLQVFSSNKQPFCRFGKSAEQRHVLVTTRKYTLIICKLDDASQKVSNILCMKIPAVVYWFHKVNKKCVIAHLATKVPSGAAQSREEWRWLTRLQSDRAADIISIFIRWSSRKRVSAADHMKCAPSFSFWVMVFKNRFTQHYDLTVKLTFDPVAIMLSLYLVTPLYRST